MNDYKEIKELLEKIKKKPGMYLGKPSLTLLKAFIDGYKLAANQYSDIDTSYLSGFTDWVAKRYSIKSQHDWASIIVFEAWGEENGFERFFELLDEFIEERSNL